VPALSEDEFGTSRSEAFSNKIKVTRFFAYYFNPASPMPKLFPFQRFQVVDDNPIDTLITTRVLQKMELVAQVDSVVNGQEAIGYLWACKQSGIYPEVILLDVDMPIMNGFAFLAQCFTEKLLGDSSVNIIMLTSSIHPRDQQQVAAYPLASFLNKPLKPQGLRRLVQPGKQTTDCSFTS
jgi:CheY-like chemotaxis protein